MKNKPINVTANRQTLVSSIDQSVNFVEKQLTGFLQSRYVRKVQEYFICYLSSQSGCNRGCKFCHLTATEQNKDINDSDYQDYVSQAIQVFRHYRKESKAKYMHYNFMARGQVLSNKYMLDQADDILMALAHLSVKQNLNPKFNMSTIMPANLNKSLTDVFRVITPTMYYSLYSMNNDFRKKWMPAAMNPEDAFDLLKQYQNMTKKIVKVHYAFIKDQNDSVDDINAICDIVDRKNILCQFNLVRYNPFSPVQGEESSEEVIKRNIDLLSERFIGKVQIIPRVGFDVKASCGMFVEKEIKNEK